MLNDSILKKFSSWTNFVSIISLILGVLSCLTIVGIIPGVISIFLGIKLWNAKRLVSEMSIQTEAEITVDKFNFVLKELATYFKAQGILILFSIAFSVILAVVSLFIFIFGIAGTGFF